MQLISYFWYYGSQQAVKNHTANCQVVIALCSRAWCGILMEASRQQFQTPAVRIYNRHQNWKNSGVKYYINRVGILLLSMDWSHKSPVPILYN